MGKFVIKNRTNGEYQFNLLASNGQAILTSEGYTSKENCMSGINSVRTNASNDERYDRRESSNGKYYFNLKAGNGQVIGTSEMYTSTAGRDLGIEAVKSNAPDAVVEDISLFNFGK